MVATLLLSVQDAHIAFGKKVLFESLTFNIHEGDKICLVGRNGAGKSTLMNVITGAQALDGGERWQLQGLTIGYLKQDVPVQPGQTVHEFVFEGLLEENREDAQAYKVEMIIAPLELDPQERMETLSGGQLRRAALARALVEDPDILLLDEPTNHMDLHLIEWLENYLKGFRGAVVCISHDRAFLSGFSDKVFWLDRGRLRVCPRGFSHFEEWSEALIEQEQRELHNRQKVLDMELEWASRGVKARRKRNVRRLEMMREARIQLQKDQNALKRMLAKIEWEPGKVEESSHVIAEFHKVSKSFEASLHRKRPKTILDRFSLRIMRGDRIGVVGKNGSGKTTFLRLLTQELKPDSGTVKRARDIALSYFDQKRKDLIPSHSLRETLCPNGGDYVNVMGKQRHVCGYLKDFLFDPQMAGHPVSILSGGQKNRLMLAKIMANPGNLLILDEPTNDLDMDTLDMLEEMLENYNGTLLVVSHDRDFLDQTVTKILAFEGDGQVEAAIGGYHDYLAMKAKQNAEDDDDNRAAPRQALPAMSVRAAASAPEKPRAAEGKMSYKLRYELENLPARMEKLEADIVRHEAALANPELFTRDPGAFEKAARGLESARAELGAAETRWLELEELRLALAGEGQ